MSDGRLRSAFAWFLVAALASVAPGSAFATQKFGPLQISGNLQTQNLVRSPDQSTYSFIQNRNTAHIRLDYDWLQGGKFYNKYNIPFVESSHLFILWRGVYDSIYDTTPGFIEKEDIHGRAYDGMTYFQYAHTVKHLTYNDLNINGLGNKAKKTLKFDNSLREAYVDVKFRQLPLTVRAGRQQIVWGETDNFRMLDRVNPLDLTWHFVWEVPAPAFGWDELRRPLWMLKFLYDLGDVWKFSQSFLEWYWNPGDWYPAKQAFLPRPWGLRFLNPLTNPVDGVFNGGVCATVGACNRLMNNTVLFNRGEYSRNPMDNSQVGVRYHGIAPFGMEFTLNYFYQRWAGDDGTNYAPIEGLPLNKKNENLAFNVLIPQKIFPAKFIAPYVHTVGASANYSDETFTQAVFRGETIYDVGIPFFDVARQTVIDVPDFPGVTKKNMWKGMIGFDRPTWIRTLNKKSTVFLTGQFFWHYLVNNPGCRAQDVARMTPGQREAAGITSCLVGGLDLPSTVRLGNSTSPAFRDKIRDWETIFTLAGFTFYRGGSIVPVVGMAVDPVNQWDVLPFWTVDYVVRDDFVVNLAQRYFVAPKGHHNPNFETWGLSGLNAGRSETSLRLTYQF
jgi:hypothetical protein